MTDIIIKPIQEGDRVKYTNTDRTLNTHRIRVGSLGTVMVLEPEGKADHYQVVWDISTMNTLVSLGEIEVIFPEDVTEPAPEPEPEPAADDGQNSAE